MGTMPNLASIMLDWWGDTYSSSNLVGLAGEASNIIVGVNPHYCLTKHFACLYPNFLGTPSVFTGTFAQGGSTIMNVDNATAWASLQPGQFISGPGIPCDTIAYQVEGYGEDNYGENGYGQGEITLSTSVDLSSLPPTIANPSAVYASNISANLVAGSTVFDISPIDPTQAFNGQILKVGMQVFGPGIPAGTTIASITFGPPGYGDDPGGYGTSGYGGSYTIALSSPATLTQTSQVSIFQPQTLSFKAYTGMIVPMCVLKVYAHLATHCLFKERYRELWEYAVGLFICHYATMWCRSQGSPASTAAQIAAQGLQNGILTSKSVGGVSAGYTSTVPESYLEMYGPSFAQTQAGCELMTLANGVAPHMSLAW